MSFGHAIDSQEHCLPATRVRMAFREALGTTGSEREQLAETPKAKAGPHVLCHNRVRHSGGIFTQRGAISKVLGDPVRGLCCTLQLDVEGCLEYNSCAEKANCARASRLRRACTFTRDSQTCRQPRRSCVYTVTNNLPPPISFARNVAIRLSASSRMEGLSRLVLVRGSRMLAWLANCKVGWGS